MEFTDSLKALFMETARSLTGSARRLFMARTVKGVCVAVEQICTAAHIGSVALQDPFSQSVHTILAHWQCTATCSISVPCTLRVRISC